MELVYKILKLIAEVIKSYFKSKSDIANSENESIKYNKEIRDSVNKDIQKAKDVIEDNNIDSLNEILK